MDALKDVHTYINNPLVLSCFMFYKQLKKLDTVFCCLDNAGLKVNVKKFKFFASEIEYLGFWFTQKACNQ